MPSTLQYPVYGFPHSIGSCDKALKFKISFQDLEKVLNLAKMHIRYWKRMERNQKYLSRILLKAKQFVIYVVLYNV